MPHTDEHRVNTAYLTAIGASGYEPEQYPESFVFSSENELRRAAREGKISPVRVLEEVKKMYPGEAPVVTERIARSINNKRNELVAHLIGNTNIGEANVSDRDSLNPRSTSTLTTGDYLGGDSPASILNQTFSRETQDYTLPDNESVNRNKWQQRPDGTWNFSPITSGIHETSNIDPRTNTSASGSSAWDGWAPVLGAYTPQQQYTALMGSTMPNYNIPGFSNLYQSQFDPTFGQYLLGGYGGGTGLGTTERFADWFRNRPTGDLGAGWNLAQQFGRTMPGGADYATLARDNPGMAYAMTQPDAIQAMAQARYFQGQDPRSLGGYATRAVQSTLGDLFTNWQRQNIASANPQAPGAFLSDLGRYGGRWA